MVELSYNRLPDGDGLLEFVDRVYVFDSCFSSEVLPDGSYKNLLHEIMNNLHLKSPESSFLAFNFRAAEKRSVFAEILSGHDVTVVEYPWQYEGCPILPLSVLQNILCESVNWLARSNGEGAILLHCERGGWPLLAFILASFLIFTKARSSECKGLKIVHRESLNGPLLSLLNPFPSQLRYLQYIASRNIASVWPPPERALSLDCVIIRDIPSFDSQQGCRPLVRVFGRKSRITSGLSTEMLYSMSKKKNPLLHYTQEDCDGFKINIHCRVQGDVVLECVHLDLEPEREVLMFRVMFNTAFIRSNILVLNSDNLDILWEAKDLYPKGFRAEVLFREVERVVNGDETGEVPSEAFSKDQEVFSGVDLAIQKPHFPKSFDNDETNDIPPESSEEPHEFLKSVSPSTLPSDSPSSVAHVTLSPPLSKTPAAPPPPPLPKTPAPPPPPPLPKTLAAPPPPPLPKTPAAPPLPKAPAPPRPPPVLGRGTSSSPLPLEAKMSSAPPPPPPAGRGIGSSGLGRGQGVRTLVVVPKKPALKPFHWSKVIRPVEGGLWDISQKQKRTPEIDILELESLFAQGSESTNAGKNKDGAGIGITKPKKIQLIDPRRAQNCEIMLRKIKIPTPDMLSAVLALDSSALDIDQVEILSKFCPTKEEMEKLRKYTGDKEMLGKCEQYFMELMTVPRIEAKLRVFGFKIIFAPQVEKLISCLNTINVATKEVKESTKLRQIMQTVLTLGNTLNHGTSRGSAVGFKPVSLLKLSEIRSRDNKMTMMHYLCKLVAEKMPELLDFAKDLVHLEAASKIELKTLAEEVQAVSKDLEKVEQELMTSENDGAISVGFREVLKDFLDSAAAEVRSLISLYSEVGQIADSLSHYLGDDPIRCPFEQVTKILIVFIKQFTKSQEENEKQAESEKRNMEKEVMKEKTVTKRSSER